MVFSSIVFLFRFMPIIFGLYYICPKKFKNLFLIISSLAFYAWGEVKSLPIIIAAVVINFFIGLAIGKNPNKKNLFLILSIILNIGCLVFFKYTDFFIQNINSLLSLNIPLLKLSLPIGISFFTFKVQSYIVDVYRGDIEPENNFVNFGAYVTLFPQLLSGPIARYKDLKPELEKPKINLNNIQSGIFTFIMGLGSKVLIADNLSGLWSELEAINFKGISTPLAWLGLIAYGLQLYFDFSGYSLMAIGMGKMLGFNTPANFNYPYASVSITEFWRRWHISLGSWFRDYVYIPLGGNRVKPMRNYFNLLAVWLLTGLWHGANWNFILWGFFFFIFICIEKAFLLKKLEKYRICGHIYLIFLIIISWGLFAISDFSLMSGYLIKLFSFSGGIDWVYYLRNYAVLLVLSCILALPIIPKLSAKLKTNRVLFGTLIAGAILIMSVAYMVDSSYNPFLYFKF